MDNEIKLALEYQAKNWSRNHMLKYNPDGLKYDLTKEEQDAAPKVQGFKFSYEEAGVTKYGYYLAEVSVPVFSKRVVKKKIDKSTTTKKRGRPKKNANA